MSDQDMAEGTPGEKPRTAQRDSMLLHASLRRLKDTQGLPIRIRNLSAGGMMAECDVVLDRGEVIEVSLRNIGVVRATVAWSVDGRIGVAFDKPIDRLRARRPVPVAVMRGKPQEPQSRRPGLRSA